MNALEDNELPAKRNLARCAIVVLRWALVAGWFALSALVQPGAEELMRAASQSLASAGLAFLLVNALWQHMPLKWACLVGALAACSLNLLALSPDFWLAIAIGSVAGVLVGYPVIQRIDRLIASRR
ncbi:hypothetical protein [Paraeggerthella sp.]|uniref:hypothetical protein n=1 Tax=Paraeggerthella sp. TaxID=2897350 RepID=UPI003AB69BCC